VTLRKVRRDGNSLVVTIAPEEAARANLVEGAYVTVEFDEVAGHLKIAPVDIQLKSRPTMTDIGKRVIAENRDVLDRLAEYDPD
jgi:antitoxin component of MazEF toxin-antitoxin module